MRWLALAALTLVIFSWDLALAQAPVANAIEHLAINVTGEPLSNVMLRQAIASAIDRRALLVAIRSRLPAAWTSASPASSWFPPGLAPHDPDVSIHSFNQTVARDLLRRAGFPDGNGLPELQIFYVAGHRHREAAAEALKTQLSAVGINVRAMGVPGFFERGLPQRQYQMAIFAWPVNEQFERLSIFMPTHESNVYGYRNADVIRLITTAGSESDPAKRVTLLREAESIILTEAPVVPLYYFFVAPR